MTQIPLEEASSQLRQLVQQAKEGEEIILTQNSEPVARLTPILPIRPRRQAGTAKGLILHMADDFDAPLDDFKEYM